MSHYSDNQQSNPRSSRHTPNGDNVWSDYVEVAKEYDDRMHVNFNTNLDVVLVFVSCYSFPYTRFSS
jgi:Family of unknown function (DUF6535)